MAEPRSAAEEARDPSTTPERLLELTEKHPQLQKLIVLNPSCPDVARQWILATNPWAKSAYDESTSGADGSAHSELPQAEDGHEQPAQQDQNDDEQPSQQNAHAENDEQNEPDEISVWGDFSEDGLWGDAAQNSDGASQNADGTKSAAASGPAGTAGTAGSAGSRPVTVRVAEDRGVVPLGPVNSAASSPAAPASPPAAQAPSPAAPSSSRPAPSGPASAPVPSPTTASAPPSAGPDAPAPALAASAGQGPSQQQYPTEQTPTAAYGLPAFSGPAAAQYGAAAPPPPPESEKPDGSDPSRRRLWFACGGCLLLALILLIVGGFGARALLAGNDDEYQRDSTTTAEEAPSSAPEESPATTEDTPSKDPVSPAPDGAHEMTELRSPSGNITCQLEKDTVACSIVDRSFSGAGLEDCADGPFSMKVSKGTAVRACGSSYLSDTAETLEYDESATHGNTACTSRSEGMTCWNTNTGHGFSVNRASYETF